MELQRHVSSFFLQEPHRRCNARTLIAPIPLELLLHGVCYGLAKLCEVLGLNAGTHFATGVIVHDGDRGDDRDCYRGTQCRENNHALPVSPCLHFYLLLFVGVVSTSRNALEEYARHLSESSQDAE